ncbi:MAG: lipid-A-disaccharide synthase, partial [Planctomycetota bacterium]
MGAGYFFLTGETSGDAYAASIIKALHEVDCDQPIAGIGGDAMQAAGIEPLERMDAYAVMGVLPVLRRLPEFVRLGKRVEQAIREHRPRVVVGIDYPGFNFRMYRRLADLRQQGLRIVHIVAPQVWAWRPRRAKRMAQSVDRLLCFFPFEPPLFRRFDCRADFVGHPLVDLVGEPARGADSRMLLLAPGGRGREVRDLLPIMIAAAELAQRWLGEEMQVVVSQAPGVPASAYAGCPFPCSRRPFRELCREAHVAIMASGTACLEAALLGLPHVIAYRLDAVSGRMAAHLIHVPWVGLPNLVHGREICRELLQDRLTVPRLAAALAGSWP